MTGGSADPVAIGFFAIFIDSVFGLPNLVNVSLERKLQIERAR